MALPRKRLVLNEYRKNTVDNEKQFTIARIHNTTEYTLGETLLESTVDRLIQKGWSIEICKK